MNLNVKKYSESNIIYYCHEEYTSRYSTKHIANIGNSYLGKSKTISAREIYDLEYKIAMQFIDWAEKESELREKDNFAASVEEKNERCKQLLLDIDNILLHTLNVNDAIDWRTLKDNRRFEEPNPINTLLSETNKLKKDFYPEDVKLPKEPNKEYYTPSFTVWDKLIKSRKREKENLSLSEYEKDYSEWLIECNKLQSEYSDKLELYKKKEQNLIEYIEDKKDGWVVRSDEFYENQKEFNKSIENQQKEYENGDIDAIETYCEMVLNNSEYPYFFQKDFDIQYRNEDKLLIVEYSLPSLEMFPQIKEYKYYKTKQEEKEVYLSLSELNKIFDKAVYDTTLRTIHELFEADVINEINSISFNGWIDTIDKSTGNRINNCIVSILVNKEEFNSINLANVDPKLCFKSLKGVASSKLHTITPITPIINYSKFDKRFIEANNIIENIDNSTNLAEINWEDFEHLVREIFEKEFSANGGEVKVTQSSRDGGVDAVAFDPDPIRGGKIVIQAKRYTNTVGVSAVRDLFGTVMNEGATKGILVTTSNFGSDSYSFAKDKPITLMNGANLLHLFQKHGVHAKIDIKAVK